MMLLRQQSSKSHGNTTVEYEVKVNPDFADIRHLKSAR